MTPPPPTALPASALNSLPPRTPALTSGLSSPPAQPPRSRATSVPPSPPSPPPLSDAQQCQPHTLRRAGVVFDAWKQAERPDAPLLGEADGRAEPRTKRERDAAAEEAWQKKRKRGWAPDLAAERAR